MAGQKKSPSEILQDGRAEKADVIKAFGISVLLYLEPLVPLIVLTKLKSPSSFASSYASHEK